MSVALEEKVKISENGESRLISKREAAAKQLANRVAMGDRGSLKLIVALLAGHEEQEEQDEVANTNRIMRDRLDKKIEAVAASVRKRFGFPPE